MQNNGTSVLVSTETDTSEATAVFGLTYGELAAALYASGLPTRAMRGVPRLELIEHAAEGLARIGAELAWWTDYRTRRINCARHYRTGQINDPAARAEYQCMWPSAARFRAAHDVASRIAQVCGPEVPTWPGRDTRTVDVEWAGRVWPVAVRDLENAARYPHRAAADPRLSAMLRAYTAPARRSQVVAGMTGGAR